MQRQPAYSSGSALPVILMLLAILGMVSGNALRTAIAETRLRDSLLTAGESFAIAELGIAAGLRFAHEHPELLPVTDALNLPPLDTGLAGRVETSLVPMGVDNLCPETGVLPVERMHFEIHANSFLDNRISGTHVQGFYICRELCTACLGIESLPVRSYWTIHDGPPG